MATTAGPPGTSGRVVLDWSKPAHWAQTPADCRVCHTPTRMRDEQGKPCHKSCREDELAAQLHPAPAALFDTATDTPNEVPR